jgi:uncharacterized protein YbjT (DUF2867 family)
MFARWYDVEGAYIIIPPTQRPSPGFPKARAVVANYVQVLRRCPPPKLVALSSFRSENPSGLGLITATRLLEQGLNDMPFPVVFVRAGGFIVGLLNTEWSGRRVIELGTRISPIEHMGLPKGSTWEYEEMLEGVNSGWIYSRKFSLTDARS